MELVGIPFVILVGSILHFVYEWTGNSAWSAVFAATNESTWEHLKLAFWPMLIWAVFGMLVLVYHRRRIPIAKAAGVVCTLGAIVVGAWLIEISIGHSLPVDILLFACSVAAGQTLSYLILIKNFVARDWWWLAGSVWGILIAAFIYFSFWPPHLPLFQDPTLKRSPEHESAASVPFKVKTEGIA